MKKSTRYIFYLLTCMIIILSSCSFKEPDNTKGLSSAIDESDTETQNESLLALYNCTIIDGTGSSAIDNGVILIKDKRIQKIGDSNGINIPKEYEKIDLEGKTVLPGFINAHVHYGYYASNLKGWLNAGVTTVRDLQPMNAPENFIEKRDEFNQNLDTARLISATPILRVEGGYGMGKGVFTSAEDAKDLVDSYADKDIDIIKFAIEDALQRSWELPTFEELKAIVDTAHSRGKKASVHITHARHLQWAVDLGVDDIAHMVVEPISDEICNQIIEKNIYWVPTLELWHRIGKAYNVETEAMTINNLAKFYKAGGKIALGTDYGGFITPFDKDFPITEVKLMKEAGMSNMDIIIAGTKNASYVCDIAEDLGTLEEGKIADILVVTGDPLVDIECLQNTYMVIHNGKIVLDYTNIEESSKNTINEVTGDDKVEATVVSSAERGPGKVVYVLPDMDKVKIAKDIIYKSEGDLELKLDVYYPFENKSNKEANPIVLVHGKTAYKNFKDTNYLDSWGRLIAVSGYPAIIFDWRSYTTPEDISDLISYVEQHSDELGVKDSSINVIAFSAGVYEGIEQVLSDEDNFINKIVSYYGEMPLSILENKDSKKPSEVLIVDGAKDSIYPKGTNDEFIKKATELGWQITHIIHSNGMHGFEIRNDEEETYEVIKKTLKFFED